MTLTEFEALRDIEGKRITSNIRFTRNEPTAPLLTAENIKIENPAGADLRMNMHFNPETGSMTFNVYVPSVGPICRLDVRSTNHPGAGRSHKHTLKTERSPNSNLPEATGRPDLAEKSVVDLFAEFCALGKITHTGTFETPEQGAQ